MSNDFSTSALNAINKSAMHHNSARRATTDQFAQVFAQNQADASRRSLQSARQPASAGPETHEQPPASGNTAREAPPATHRHAAAGQAHTDRASQSNSAQTPRDKAASAADNRDNAPKQESTTEDDAATRTTCPREDAAGDVLAADKSLTDVTDGSTTNLDVLAIEPQTLFLAVEIAATAPVPQADNNTVADTTPVSAIGVTDQAIGTVAKSIDTPAALAPSANPVNQDGKQAQTAELPEINPLNVLTGQKPAKAELSGSASDKSAKTSTDDKLFATSADKTLDALDHALIAKFKADTHAAKTDEPASTTLPKSGAQGESVNADKKPALAANAAISKAAVLNPSAAIVLPQPVAQTFQATLGRLGINAAASVADASATLASLPVSIGSRALKGAREFTIHLDPAELGKVEVKMEINDKGEIKANLTVDRVETLQLLQRDAKTLERALEQAGFKPSDDALQFSLRQDNGQNQQRAGSDWNQGSKSLRANPSDLTDKTTSTVDVTAAVMSAYARRNNSALDIHV